MNYARKLTAELRYRGLSENRIAEVLAEVEDHTPAGEDPAIHFGEPSVYAERYASELPRMKPKTAPILVIAVVLSLTYVVFAFLGRPLFGVDVTDYIGPIRLWPAMAILGIGVMASFLNSTYRRVHPTTPDPL